MSKIRFAFFVSSALCSQVFFHHKVMASPKLCQDLASFSCAPGTYDDGTGSVREPEEVDEKITEYSDKTKNALNADFVKVMQSPEAGYFREIALSAMGLQGAPECVSKDPADKVSCDQKVASGLTRVAQRQVFGKYASSNPRARLGSWKDLAYITENDQFVSIVNSYREKAEKDFQSPKIVAKVENEIFPKVRTLIVNRLNAMDIPDEKKKVILDKVKAIRFDKSSCAMVPFGQKASLDQMLVPNASYFSMRNVFKYCDGFALEATSEFSIAMTVAHELSHSFDPCSLGNGPTQMPLNYSKQDKKKKEKESPFRNIVACLRSPRSIAAKDFAQTLSDPKLQANTTYGVPTADPNDFCANDQIGESFSDWMAAEVLPQYIEQNHKLSEKQYQLGYSNAFRMICSESVAPANLGYGTPVVMGVHPATRDRINKIIMANPKIRSHMGCKDEKSEAIYCDSEKKVIDIPDAREMPTDNGAQAAPGGTR